MTDKQLIQIIDNLPNRYFSTYLEHYESKERYEVCAYIIKLAKERKYKLCTTITH